MTFKSQHRRMLVVSFLFGIAVDAVFVWTLLKFLDPEPPTLANVGLGFLMLQAAYFVIGIRNSAAAWLTFFLWGRKAGTGQIVALLRAEGFERRSTVYFSPSDYFQEIIDDEKAPLAMRIKAAIFLGLLTYPASGGHGLEALRLNMLYEDALSQI